MDVIILQGGSAPQWGLVAASSVGALISGISAWIAFKSLQRGIDMFKREGIFDLHDVWSDVDEISLESRDEVVTPDVVKVVNALSLTASLWNHDIMEKAIIYQTCWEEYRMMYDKINGSDTQIPGIGRRADDLIENPMDRAYQEMLEYDVQEVEQTEISLWSLMKS